MKVEFTYRRDKDVWCLLEKGPRSFNSALPTPTFTRYAGRFGPELTTESAAYFIDELLTETAIDLPTVLESFSRDWETCSVNFIERADKIFNVSVDRPLTAYLTVNERCPYDLLQGSFFVSLRDRSLRLTVMHELWHFYTWERFGLADRAHLGASVYNCCNEALTVLLNEEMRDLLPSGLLDRGYPQHHGLRSLALSEWQGTRDIKLVWEVLTAAAVTANLPTTELHSK